MEKLWHRYAPYWHICTAIIASVIAASFWVKDVSAYANRFVIIESKQQISETKQEALTQDLTDIKIGQSRIEQKVDDLASWMRNSRHR